MCFAPQRGTLFRDLNFQKWSENGVLCKFWLGNVLRANTVHFFDISTSKNGPNLVCLVHFDLETCFASQRRTLFRLRNFQKRSEADFFISHLARWLRTHRFTNHWETQWFPAFLPFRAPASCFFWLFLFSDLLSSSLLWLFLLFHLSILSEVSLLNFLRSD